MDSMAGGELAQFAAKIEKLGYATLSGFPRLSGRIRLRSLHIC